MLEKDYIYMIGIGGIGMSALARYFVHMGKQVAGYDRSASPISEALQQESIRISFSDEPAQIPEEFRDPAQCLVIYTPAVAPEHAGLQYFRQHNFEMVKRARALGAISAAHRCLAVAGTHGKTTTSALLAHLFKQADHPITAFLGGIAVNYQSNFLAGEAGELLVAEADEYDRSFLQLSPAGAIITSTDSDHLDIYGTAEELKQTFQQFAAIVQGPLICHPRTGLEGMSYAVEEAADYQALDLRIEEHLYRFDLRGPEGLHIKDIKSGLPGRHNVENATAAAALALQFGLSPAEVKAGIASFKGVKRRFEYHIKQEELVYIDDYAHHPAEITALLGSVRELYPQHHITAIFQPHLYSRTRDYADEFASALGLADELFLMEIYPAREKPIPGVHANMLLSKVTLEVKQIAGSQEILTAMKGRQGVVLTIGAGDIDRLVGPLKMSLLQ